MLVLIKMKKQTKQKLIEKEIKILEDKLKDRKENLEILTYNPHLICQFESCFQKVYATSKDMRFCKSHYLIAKELFVRKIRKEPKYESIEIKETGGTKLEPIKFKIEERADKK
jgi:hypothetical protein